MSPDGIPIQLAVQPNTGSNLVADSNKEFAGEARRIPDSGYGRTSLSNVTLPLIPDSGTVGGGPKRAGGTPGRTR